MAEAYTDEFYYVPLLGGAMFSGGQIEPVEKLAEIIEAVKGYTNPDGFIYPPIIHTRTGWPKKKSRRIPGSERAASLYKLPVTHTLRLDRDDNNREALRNGDAGFLIHLFAFLYGFRAQFHDWWIDSRVKAKSDTDYHQPRAECVARCIDAAFRRFQIWPSRQQTVAINCLFLHSRIWGHEMEWERFQAAYQVVDGVYALARDTAQLPRRTAPHADRLSLFCQHFGIAADEEKIQTVVKLRNELLHEVLWDGGMPGTARSNDSFYAAIWLENLGRRMILAALGLTGTYIRSPWWGLSAAFFDVAGS